METLDLNDGIDDLESVLNAFRHQRWKPAGAFGITTRLCMCSTPFGIRDGNPFGHSHFLTLDIVLNAFRHQRWKPTMRRLLVRKA